jgi:hypothetical protein
MPKTYVFRMTAKEIEVKVDLPDWFTAQDIARACFYELTKHLKWDWHEMPPKKRIMVKYERHGKDDGTG